MEYFSKAYNIPIEDNLQKLSLYDTVFFSLISFRDFYDVARISKYKGKSEWIAGGNAVTNPTGIMWIMDYVFIGDCFYSFEKLLKGERDIEGLLNCKNPKVTEFQIEPVFSYPIADNEIMLSKGCKRKCVFCVNTWKTIYQENDKQNIINFLNSYSKKSVYLSSNSSDDVSYYANIIVPILHKRNISDLTVSNSISGMNDIYLKAKNSEMLFGVEGMSERLRYIVNKPIKREKLLETIHKCLDCDKVIRTVYQFNLPSETLEDFTELEENIEIIFKDHKKGLWRIPFIPNHPDPFTPLQWEKPYYNIDMWSKIKCLYEKYQSTLHKEECLKIFIPTPLSCSAQFSEIITDWIPITPEVLKIVNRILKNKNKGFDYCLQTFKEYGYDLEYIFKKKPQDYVFPWDSLVKVYTSKEKLWGIRNQMYNKI